MGRLPAVDAEDDLRRGGHDPGVPPRERRPPSERRYPPAVRVVAGRAKGRVLRAPDGQATRPTSDRVREAAFSVLLSLRPIQGATVVDLFAGSGALGIEALSRGAARATFVERDRRALAAIRANLTALALEDAATVVAGDAEVHAALAVGDGADLVFADPPYSFDGWPRLLATIRGAGFAGLALIETGHSLELGVEWDAVRVKRYGDTVVTVARPRGEVCQP